MFQKSYKIRFDPLVALREMCHWLTVRRCVHYDEACVDLCLLAILSFEGDGIGMPAKTRICFEKVYIVTGTLERPKSTYA